MSWSHRDRVLPWHALDVLLTLLGAVVQGTLALLLLIPLFTLTLCMWAAWVVLLTALGVEP